MNGRGIAAVVTLALATVAGCATPSAIAPTERAGAAQATPSPEPSCACSFPPTAPPGALSRDSAIAAARTATPGATATTEVYWADWYSWDTVPWPTGASPTLPASTTIVWEVRLGGIAGSPSPTCDAPVPAGPGATPCLDVSHSTVVVLDGRTGALFGWTQ